MRTHGVIINAGGIFAYYPSKFPLHHRPEALGRVAFLAADLDRRFGCDHLPDHAHLLANLVRWTANGQIPLGMSGAGLVDCHLYQQGGRVILRVVNLTSADTWRAPLDEFIRIRPFEVRVQLPSMLHVGKTRLLVADVPARFHVSDRWASFELKSILDHGVVVIG